MQEVNNQGGQAAWRGIMPADIYMTQSKVTDSGIEQVPCFRPETGYVLVLWRATKEQFQPK